jgi:flagellar motility protein MotE (MotC chaperone)
LQRRDSKIEDMSVKDIEQAIAELPPSDVAELAQWFEEFQAQVWDKQIEQDAKSGRFAHLIEQAKADYAAGRCKPL